ncbi:MAG: hypothetical protein ABI564_15600, partial [Ideonella sp.]
MSSDGTLTSGPSPLRRPFKGRIIQVMDALDYGDAVSNQALALDRLLLKLGYDSVIASRWVHEKVLARRIDIDELEPEDRDVVIFHFSGYSAHAWARVKQWRCTRICLYHNITPH